MILNDPVIFSAQLWEFLLVGALVLAVVVMAVIYIRRLERGRNEDRAAAIRVGLLLQQNRALLEKVNGHISRCHQYISDLEKDQHNLTLQVCELKSRVNYYENGTLMIPIKYD